MVRMIEYGVGSDILKAESSHGRGGIMYEIHTEHGSWGGAAIFGLTGGSGRRERHNTSTHNQVWPRLGLVRSTEYAKFARIP